MRVWRGRVMEVFIDGVLWRTSWHPVNGVAGWFIAAFLVLVPTALITLVLRLDLHRRLRAWHRIRLLRLVRR